MQRSSIWSSVTIENEAHGWIDERITILNKPEGYSYDFLMSHESKP